MYWQIRSIQEHYSKKRLTHLSIFIHKFSITPGCCHILTVLLHAAWNSWAMWFLRFYFRAAAVKHRALFTLAFGTVDKIKSFNPAVWFFQLLKAVSTQVRAYGFSSQTNKGYYYSFIILTSRIGRFWTKIKSLLFSLKFRFLLAFFFSSKGTKDNGVNNLKYIIFISK